MSRPSFGDDIQARIQGIIDSNDYGSNSPSNVYKLKAQGLIALVNENEEQKQNRAIQVLRFDFSQNRNSTVLLEFLCDVSCPLYLEWKNFVVEESRYRALGSSAHNLSQLNENQAQVFESQIQILRLSGAGHERVRTEYLSQFQRSVGLATDERGANHLTRRMKSPVASDDSSDDEEVASVESIISKLNSLEQQSGIKSRRFRVGDCVGYYLGRDSEVQTDEEGWPLVVVKEGGKWKYFVSELNGTKYKISNSKIDINSETDIAKDIVKWDTIIGECLKQIERTHKQTMIALEGFDASLE